MLKQICKRIEALEERLEPGEIPEFVVGASWLDDDAVTGAEVNGRIVPREPDEPLDTFLSRVKQGTRDAFIVLCYGPDHKPLGKPLDGIESNES